MKKDGKSALYNIFITILALISIVLCILDIHGTISLSLMPYKIIDSIILIIFTADYIVRFFSSQDKKVFFKENIFDLIAIFPFNSAFSIFRISRLSRIFRLLKITKLAKFTKFIRLFGFFGTIKKKVHRFLHTNGLLNMIYSCIVLIMISSCLVTYVEKDTFNNFSDALWWSVVTCTTVGYGDFYPTTSIGRVVATMLMLFGIGLMSMLTSAITSYFAETKNQKQSNDIDISHENINSNLLEIIKQMNSDEQQQLFEIAKIIKPTVCLAN